MANVLREFFTPEAGQRRRAWLDGLDERATNALVYYGGPAGQSVVNALNLGAMASDAADYQDYVGASRDIVADPNLGNLAALATAGTALMIPGVSARMAEGAVDFGQDLARFGREEDGAIRAFHGSPHDFDKFSMDKIGTGEGAQAYGHGLYFAESEGVAKSYRDQLAQNTFDGGKPNWDDPQDLAAYWAGKAGMTTAPTRADRVSAANWLDGSDDPAAAEARRILLSDEPLKQLGKAQGHMYEVNINADPADFLDWDAPLGDQSKTVRERLGLDRDDSSLITRKKTLEARRDEINRANIEGVDFDLPENWDLLWRSTPELDAINEEIGKIAKDLAKSPEGVLSDVKANIDDYQGEWLNKILAGHLGGKAGAAESLREAGIPGIKYKDAMSRDGAGDGTRNYVVFDDSLIDIVRKYGWAAAFPMIGAQQQEDGI